MRTKSPQRKILRRNNLSNYDNYINVSDRRKQLSRNLSDRRKQLRSRNLTEYDNYVSNKQSNEINPLYFLFGDDNDEIEKLKEQIKMLESKKDEECQKKLEQCNKDLAECNKNLNSINTQMRNKITELNAKIAESNTKSITIENLFNAINVLNQNHRDEINILNKTSEAQRKSMGDHFDRQIQSLNNQKTELEQQKNKLITTISELEKSIESLTDQIEKLNSDLKGRDENLQKLQGEIQNIKNINKIIQVKILSYKKALGEKKNEIKKLEENLNNQTATDLQKEAEIKQLKGQILNNLLKQTVTNAVTNAEKDAINKIDISKLTSEKNGLIIQLNKLSEELESLKKSEGSSKEQIEELKRQLLKQEKEHIKLNEDIETRKKIKIELDNLISGTVVKTNELNNTINSLNIELGEKTKLENARVKKTAELEELNRQLNVQFDGLTNNINGVFKQFKLEFVNPDTNNVDSVTPNYKHVNSAISQLEKFINEKNNNNEELSKNINGVFKQFNLKFVNPDTKSEDSVTPNYVKSAISQLEQFINKINKNNEEVKEILENNVESLTKDSQKKDVEINKLKTELLNIRNQLVLVQNNNVAYKEERDAEFKKLKDEHTEEIKLKEIEFNKNCDEKIKQITVSLNTTHKLDIDALRVSLQSDYKRVQTQLIKNHELEIQKLIGKHTELINEYKSEINKLKENITGLTTENNKLKTEEIDTRQQKIDVLVREISVLNNQIREISSGLQVLEKKIGKSKKGDGKKKYKRKSGKRRNKKM